MSTSSNFSCRACCRDFDLWARTPVPCSLPPAHIRAARFEVLADKGLKMTTCHLKDKTEPLDTVLPCVITQTVAHSSLCHLSCVKGRCCRLRPDVNSEKKSRSVRRQHWRRRRPVVPPWCSVPSACGPPALESAQCCPVLLRIGPGCGPNFRVRISEVRRTLFVACSGSCTIFV